MFIPEHPIIAFVAGAVRRMAAQWAAQLTEEN